MPGAQRLKDVSGVQYRAPAFKLKGLCSKEDAEALLRHSLFVGVHPACATCTQANVSFERSMGASEEIIATAHCKGQLETIEMDVVRVSTFHLAREEMMPIQRVVRKCPDEIRMGTHAAERDRYSGMTADRVWLDEFAEIPAGRMVGGKPEPYEPPKPKAPKYDQFGDW